MTYNETYELMIELFWIMLFVEMSYFKEIVLFINIDWIFLFSFHLIDKTGWFKELMKRREKIWKVIWVFFIPLISVLFGVFDEMVVPIIVWVFPTDSHELEHPRDYMCKSDVRLPILCDCGWDGLREGSGMIIEHQSHSQNNTVPNYPVCQSECGDDVLFRSDWLMKKQRDDFEENECLKKWRKSGELK